MRSLLSALWIVLVLSSTAWAGLKGDLAALLADYDDVNEKVEAIRSAREEGYSSDQKALLEIISECLKSNSRVASLHLTLLRDRDGVGQIERARLQSLLTGLNQNFLAVHAFLFAERDYTYNKSPELLQIHGKYIEAWRLAQRMVAANRSKQ